MMRLKFSRQLIIAILLVFVAAALGYTSESGFSIGDKLFLAIGIAPWSNGQTGFHYPSLIAFMLFIIGLIEARKVITGGQLFIFLILLMMLAPSVLASAEPAYYRMHSGLAAVQYDGNKTIFNLMGSGDYQNMKIAGAITLTNYGKETLEFGIKIPVDNFIQKDFFTQDLLLTDVNDSDESVMFVLCPGETRTILTCNVVPVKNGYNGQGTMNGPNLVLFNDHETRTIGRNL